MFKDSFFLMQKPGQLGNRLVQSAPAIAFAREHGLRVFNLALDEYAHLFEGSRGDLLARFPSTRSRIPPSPTRRRWLFNCTDAASAILKRVDPKQGPGVVAQLDWDEYAAMETYLPQARSSKPLFIKAWFLMERTVAKHAPAIRQYFRPVPPLQQRIESSVGQARAFGEPVVGLHIRQGDYGGFLDGQYLYTWNDYHAIVESVAEIFDGRCTFLVTSDSQQAEAAMHGTRGGRILFAGGSAVEDLYALAACDYIVGPPSTFSLWAAFYGETPLFPLFDAAAPTSLEHFTIPEALYRDQPPKGLPKRGRDPVFEGFLGRRVPSNEGGGGS